MSMFYRSAGVAIAGAVGYQYFVKRVPSSLNPIVSVIAMYVAVLAIGVALLTLFPADGGLQNHFRQLSWIQLGLAVSVHHRHYRSREEARRDIFEFIEVFYNRQRLHSALGYRSPVEFEALHNLT